MTKLELENAFKAMIWKLENDMINREVSSPTCFLVSNALPDLLSEYRQYLVGNVLENSGDSIRFDYDLEWDEACLVRIMVLTDFAKTKGIDL